MRRPALLLLTCLLLPGCVFTEGVWSWADDPTRVDGPSVAALTTWSRGDDETFRVVVRYSDGREVQRLIGGDVSGTPKSLLGEVRRHYDLEEQAELVLLAVDRGLVSRDFADDPAYAKLRDRPAFRAASVAPLVTPTFTLGPIQDRAAELYLFGDDGRAVAVGYFRPLDGVEYHPSRGIVALLASPFSLTLDLVTLPVQAVYFGIIILAVGSGGSR